MTPDTSASRPSTRSAWGFGAAVAAVMAAYYVIFFFPPRMVGASEPDRYFHLGLSSLIANHGLFRSLPQVEDLGWGNYFPDKEFLFHALTGTAYWLAGSQGVLLLVPMFGISIALCLYFVLVRSLTPARAATVVSAAMVLSPVFLYRLSLLRPHLPAILCFCLLLGSVLRGRGKLAALSAAGFALSYHAFYIPIIVIATAACCRWQEEGPGLRTWKWALIGLVFGIVLNPYFPSTLVMSWIHLKIALGIGMPSDLQGGGELQPLSMPDYLEFFGYLPVALIAAWALVSFKRLGSSAEMGGLWFLLLLSTIFVGLSLKSSRAIEYATPTSILLTGHVLSVMSKRRWIFAAIVLLVATQGHSAYRYYRDTWTLPQQGLAGWYLSTLEQLPAEADGKKVFNCEWEAGSYILLARPSVRFVDLLEPALLWEASPQKYGARQRLLRGEVADPARVLRGQFRADYVLCGSRTLTQQLLADPRHFELLGGFQPGNPVRIFRVRD